MSFNINRFRTNMVNDGARPNLFEVELTFPGQGPSAGSAAGTSTIPELNGTGTPQTARFLVKAAQLPGSTVGTVTVPYFGREVKFAGNRTFPDWTVTIINDEDFKLRNAFETWLNYINGHQENLRGKLGSTPTLNYFSDLSVRQFSKGGSIIKGYKFIQAFPVDVSPIDLNWGDNDAIEEFTVTFAYQYWLSGTTDQTVRFDPLGDQKAVSQTATAGNAFTQ